MDRSTGDWGMNGMIVRPILMQDEKGDDGDNANRGTSVITRTKPVTKKPNLYRVLLLNDD